MKLICEECGMFQIFSNSVAGPSHLDSEQFPYGCFRCNNCDGVMYIEDESNEETNTQEDGE